MKKKTPPVKVCSDCIHENACQAWNIGTIHCMDATNCINYETIKDSTAYFIGLMDGEKSTVQDRVKRAFVALGYDLERHKVSISGYKVFLDNKYFGIWDDNRRTFVD